MLIQRGGDLGMDVSDRLRNIGERIAIQLPHIQTEEATKLALINPFIREVLGYDTTDLTEVVPEYTADVGGKKAEKVDYAILHNGQPLILIEAKKAGSPLHEQEPSQLYRYFTVTHSARFGIYTDGIKYLFYSDLEKANLMDLRPFLVLDLLDLDPVAVAEVAKFVKSEFNPDHIRASANQLKYTQAIKNELQTEIAEPSEELVRLLMGRIYRGLRTQERVDQFKVFTKAAARQLIRDELRGKFNTALAHEESTIDSEAPTPVDAEEDGIVTTDEELNAFYATKAILHGIVDPKRVHIRDSKRSCTVLLDNTNRKPLCRFWFNSKQKYLGLFDENRSENRIPIDEVDDIYQYAETLRATAGRYD